MGNLITVLLHENSMEAKGRDSVELCWKWSPIVISIHCVLDRAISKIQTTPMLHSDFIYKGPAITEAETWKATEQALEADLAGQWPCVTYRDKKNRWPSISTLTLLESKEFPKITTYLNFLMAFCQGCWVPTNGVRVRTGQTILSSLASVSLWCMMTRVYLHHTASPPNTTMNRQMITWLC